MPTCQTSVACCESFKTEYEKITGQKYIKADERIYKKLNEYGNENKAIEIAEQKLQQQKDSGKINPSDMYPATTLHKLIKEIKNKADNT